MKIRYVAIIFLTLISCERSTVTIENNSDRDVRFFIATERDFDQKDLVLDRKLEGVSFTPRYGHLKANDRKRIDSPFEGGYMSWADGVNSLCEDQAITFIFVPSDGWIVQDLIPDAKWGNRKELTLTVKELDSLQWTVRYLP